MPSVRALCKLSLLLLVAGTAACKPSSGKGGASPAPVRTPDSVDEAIALEKDCLSRAAAGYVAETIASCRRSIDLFVAAGMQADAPRLQVLRNAITVAEVKGRSAPAPGGTPSAPR